MMFIVSLTGFGLFFFFWNLFSNLINVPLVMNESPKPLKDAINMYAGTDKIKDIRHCQPNHIFYADILF